MNDYLWVEGELLYAKRYNALNKYRDIYNKSKYEIDFELDKVQNIYYKITSQFDEDSILLGGSVTKHLTERLLKRKPLTPVTGEPHEWDRLTMFDTENFKSVWTNNRLSSLYKYEDYEGRVYYNDCHRFEFFDIYNPNQVLISSHRIESILNRDILPITFPYYILKPYIVYYNVYKMINANLLNILYYSNDKDHFTYLNIFMVKEGAIYNKEPWELVNEEDVNRWIERGIYT